MLSYKSPDSYKLTVHNTITLCHEMSRIYDILKRSDQIQQYYTKYMPLIIDETLCTIESDGVIKECLGKRLDSIVTGLSTAKTDHSVLSRWINQLTQSCNLQKYTDINRDRIVKLVCSDSGKKELARCINNYFVSLVNYGYNVEYLHQTLIKFFDNRYSEISNVECIKDFLGKFTFKETKIQLYLVIDTYLIDKMANGTPLLKKIINTKELNEEEIKAETESSRSLQAFYDSYKAAKSKESISMLSFETDSIDAYNALNEIDSYLQLLQALNCYFVHRYERKLYFDVVQKVDNKYIPVKLRKKVPPRPFVDQGIIDARITKTILGKTVSRRVMTSLISSLGMHLDAINCRSEDTMLRTFWTATEALFYDPTINGERENAIYSLLHIVEKTYTLKLFRTLFSQVKTTVPSASLAQIDITTFEDFLKFFSGNDSDSSEFKKLSELLSQCPILRSRVYNLRKELRDSEHIRKKLKDHTESAVADK